MTKQSLTFLTAAAALSLGLQSATAEDWPRWRGPDHSCISKETGLLKQWPAGGPKRLWLNENAGIGFAGFAVADGKLFTIGSRDGEEQLIALNTDTGKELWATKVGDNYVNAWGDGPRSSPTVDDGLVYAMSASGDLICAKTSNGGEIWRADMKKLGGEIPKWGYSESVLVDGDKVICTPGGSKGAVVAFNKKNGSVIWQSKEFTDGAQYVSMIPIDHDGKRQYVQLTMNTLAGLDAKSGKVLWQSDWPGRTAVVPTPIHRDGRIYITTGYGVGSKQVQLSAGGKVEDTWVNKVMKNHHGGVILVGDHLYGYSDGAGWLCQDFATGERVWSERKALGKGAVFSAEGMLYCLDERDGTLALVKATPKGWEEHGRFKIDPQTKIDRKRGKIWTHPVVANGKLYLRDQEYISCYDVKAR